MQQSGFGVPVVIVFIALFVLAGSIGMLALRGRSALPPPAASSVEIISDTAVPTTDLATTTQSPLPVLAEPARSSIQPSFELFEVAPSARPTNPLDTALSDASASAAADITPLNCTGAKWDLLRCYGAYFADLVRANDPVVAMMNLKARYAVDAFVKTECHQLAHVVGRSAAAKYPSVSEAYVRGDPACWSGYYHGVMEGVLSKHANESNALSASTLNTFCADIRTGPNDYSFDYFNCVHGIGHGLMYIRDNELFESLDMCALLLGSWEQSSCAGGAFMENVIADDKNHFAKYLKSDDLFYPCNASPDIFKRDCYLMQTSYMLKQTGVDFQRVFELCSQVEAPYVDTCYQSLGRDASGWHSSDVESTKSTCLLGKDFRQQSNCVLGAIRDFISYYHSDVQGKELCAALPTDLTEICTREIGVYYSNF